MMFVSTPIPGSRAPTPAAQTRFLPNQSSPLKPRISRVHQATTIFLAIKPDPNKISRNESLSSTESRKMERDIVILGGGIIGASTAYHIAQRGHAPRVLILEKEGVACSSSGKAGGFLAKSWGDGSPTQALHRQSFDLHQELAKELGVESFRVIPTLEVSHRKGSNVASWLDGQCSSKLMDANTAQVTPDELTKKMMAAAVSKGCELRLAAAENVTVNSSNRKKFSILVSGHESPIECDQLIVAMGSWSVQLESWFGLSIPMEGIQSTSLIFYNTNDQNKAIAENPYALFCGEDKNGCHLEVYPRSNGDVYVCGIGGSEHLQPPRLLPTGDRHSASQVLPSASRAAKAQSSLASISPSIFGNNRQPDVIQSCIRPCAADALPMLGPVDHIPGLYVATAHNCWGILWAPITGKIIADLLFNPAECTIDLDAFSPSRFMKTRQSRGRGKQSVPVGEQW